MNPLKRLAYVDLPHRPYHLAASRGGQVIVSLDLGAKKEEPDLVR
jgi:hypothetical protein